MSGRARPPSREPRPQDRGYALHGVGRPPRFSGAPSEPFDPGPGSARLVWLVTPDEPRDAQALKGDAGGATLGEQD